ncbi:MAG: zinc ribbon domain-containing protein [Actinomycetota bacterium]
MYCRECGKEIADNSDFCGYCGADLRGAAVQAQPPAPPGPQAYVPPPPAGAPRGAPGGYAAPLKKSPLPWVLGGIGVLAVVAIVLVLVFVVFGGDGGSDASSPERVVENFYKAIEKQDVDMLLDTIEPSFREELEDALGENLDVFFGEYFFSAFPEDLKVEIRKMETEIDGDEAVVTVVDGTVTYTDEYGDKVTEEAADGEVEPTQLVKVDGKWYLSGEALRDSGIDPDELGDLDFDGEDGDNGGDNEDGEDDGREKGTTKLEEAMLAYAEENSAEGLEFEIYNIFTKGDEACAVAFCTNEDLEVPYILMEKVDGEWEGVDFGTGWDPPAWYENKMANVEEAMLAYVEEETEGDLEFEISGLFIKGDEACGAAICTNQELDAPWVVMRKTSQGWEGVALRSGDDPPSWYPGF